MGGIYDLGADVDISRHDRLFQIRAILRERSHFKGARAVMPHQVLRCGLFKIILLRQLFPVFETIPFRAVQKARFSRAGLIDAQVVAHLVYSVFGHQAVGRPFAAEQAEQA